MSNTAILEPPVIESTPNKDKPKPAKPWAVVVLNDDEHTFQYVIELLRKIFKYDVVKCFKLAEEIDQKGRAVVWSGSKEVAELKRDQIKGGGTDFYASEKPVKYPLGCYIEELP